ncbi:DUF3237 domain-containing protein [Oryzobacter telluris]|uniref:DUF3237 domain-containing protein n=1 Tax=Oryzobacter telluris TaxID=3149179 RepID=UPI00370DB25E
MSDALTELRGRFLGTLDIEGETPVEMGATPYGRRRVVNIAGGRVSGPHLNGEILRTGQDSALIRNDGVFEHDVRMMLRLNPSELVRVTYWGRWHSTELERLLRREGTLDDIDSYLRIAVSFETASPTFAWLNTIVAVGIGRPRMGTTSGIVYEIHEVL